MKKIVIILTFVMVFLSLYGCKSKKVKYNNYTTKVMDDIIEKSDEETYILFAGKHQMHINARMEELKYFSKDIDKNKIKNVQWKFYKNDEEKITIDINNKEAKIHNNGDDDKYWESLAGEKINKWINNDNNMSITFLYPEIEQYIEECDTFQVFCNYNDGKISQLYEEPELLTDYIRKGAVAMEYDAKYNSHALSESDMVIDIYSFALGHYNDKIIKFRKSMEERPEIYIKISKLQSFEEIETGESIYTNKVFIKKFYYDNENSANSISVDSIIEFGKIIYDDNNKESYEPVKNENGNIYNGICIKNSGTCYRMIIEYEGIKNLLEPYTIIEGFAGENYKSEVYAAKNYDKQEN